MITKILRLHGLGTLHAPLTSTGALTFKQKAILFGENGRGKSTFVALLRSLATGDASILRQRVSIEGTNPQCAQILINQQSHELTNSNWSKAYPNISIFDSHFIEKNVYAGASVAADNRKNLLAFAIGEDGVEMAHKVDDLATQISNQHKIENKCKEQVQRHIKGQMDPERFLRLDPPGEDATSEIAEQRNKVDALRRASIIQRLQTFSPISLDDFSLPTLNEILGQTLESISSSAEAKLKAHLDQTHASEEWVAEGVAFNSGDHCPYCAQHLKRSEIVGLYPDYFGAAYREYKQSLKSHLETLEQVWSLQKQANLRNTVEVNRSRLLQWAEYIPEAILEFDTDKAIAIIEAARAALHTVASRKIANPLEKIDLTQEELRTFNSAEDILTAVDEYNAAEVNINERVQALRESIQAGNLSEAETNLSDLENKIARHSQEAKAACDAWIAATNERERLEQEKRDARTKLDEFTSDILVKYKDAINLHLEKCATSFRISTLKTAYQGGIPRCEFGIELFGKPVDLASKATSPISFDSALSQGDKNALAFAFFLARLEDDPKRLEKIVIFDDPLSSLDSGRRRYTRKKIAELSNQVAQMIVLTHEEATVAEISNHFGEDSCSTFELRPEGKYSVFTSVTAAEIAATEYAKYFRTLTHYRYGHGDRDSVVKAVRPFLEINLRYRFPEEFKAESLGQMIGKIRSADSSKPLARMASLLSELDNINDYCTKHSHGDKALQNAERVIDSELKPIVNSALEISRGLPTID